ncbi:MAG: signal peptidase II [Candidatus Hydrogenedentes bacterium]|nr:signal peptidase II [Candidatus Hydrogenedentota bacterium]
MKSRKEQLLLILAIFIFVVVSDQISKAIVRSEIQFMPNPFAGREEVFFFFTHQQNPGLVNGIFQDRPYLAKIMPLFACGVLVYLYRHLDPASRIQTIAWGLVAGGAIGNIIDRFWFGVVTDFLQVNFYFVPFEFPWKRFPAFNLADSAICTGVFLLILSWRNVQNPTEEPRVPNPV